MKCEIQDRPHKKKAAKNNQTDTFFCFIANLFISLNI